MQLRVRRGHDATWVVVEVTVAGQPWGSDLVGALAESGLVDGQDRAGMTAERTGRLIDAPLPLSELGLREGDLIVAGTSDHPVPVDAEPTRSEWVLVVGSGPDAGMRIPLSRHDTVVGRASTAGGLSDIALSREHFVVHAAGDDWTLQDLGSRNGTFYAGSRVGDQPQPAAPAIPIEAGASLFRVVRHPQQVEVPRVLHRDGVGEFNRAPRLASPPPPGVHAVQAPPSTPPPRRIPLIAAAAPLLMAPMFVLMGGGVAFLALALLSPVMVLASWWEDRVHGGRDHRDEVAAYRRDLERQTAVIAHDVRREAKTRWAQAPDPAELIERTAPTTALWERRPHDADFLRLRVGWGETASAVAYRLGDGGDPVLRGEVETALDPLLVASSAPITLELRDQQHIGVVSRGAEAEDMQRWLLFQLCVLHSPRDVTVAAVVPNRSTWQWLDRMPHARWRESGGVAAGPIEGRHLLHAVTALVEARKGERRESMGGRTATLPALVVLVDDRVELPRSAVTTVLEEGSAVGVHLVWFTDSRAGVPGQCGAVATTSGAVLDVVWTGGGDEVSGAASDLVPREAVEGASWAMTGLRDAATRDRTAEVPATVTLAETLGMTVPSAAGIAERWRQASGLGAPIGLGVDGPIHLDLRTDGPHALLGGTTGAGKSELLQTLVVSLAASHPPDALTFLLVDYKGGAAFKDCVELPHTVGYVTDLDGHLVSRVLVSLNAELGHRERQLAQVGAKDLVDMQRKAPHLAPPSLLVVVDEFAALASELPEFVDGVVNLAQRGRSLGMHLLLATQRPAGAINDNIRANTNLRISLRMNDRADSEDVIGTPVAAALPRSLPGRAYVRTGSTELVEVQVAYGGGTTFGRDLERASVTVSWGCGNRSTKLRLADGPAADPVSDLQHLVSVVSTAFDASGSPTPRVPWLSPLPAFLSTSDLPLGRATRVALGRRDEPHRQTQVPHEIDVVRDGGLLVAGAAGTGKTTVLRTLAARLAEQASPGDLQLYGLDFGSRGLAGLAALPHTGDVVSAEQTDKVVRLLTMLDLAIRARRDEMARLEASSFGDLRDRQLAAGLARTPHLVVFLDGYASFAQAFERVDYGAWVERLPTAITDGRTVGLHWVVTADRRLSVPAAVQSALPQRLVLRFNDVDEYDGFGLPRAIVLDTDLPAGRGFAESAAEVQVAVLGTDPSGAGQASCLTALGASLEARHQSDVRPARVRLLESEVVLADVDVPSRLEAVVLGLGDLDFEPATVDLRRGGLLVAGARRSGKSTTLRTLAEGMHTGVPGARLVLLSVRPTPLADLPFWHRHHHGMSACEDAVEEWLLDVDARPESAPWELLVVDDADELTDQLVDDRLAELVSRGADRQLRVLAAADKAGTHRAYGGLLRRLRAERAGVILQPDPDIDGDLFDAVIDRRHRGGPPGRAVVVAAGMSRLVQVALTGTGGGAS